MAAVHKIKFEYIQPTDIECEVPGQQELREFVPSIQTEEATIPSSDSAISVTTSAKVGENSENETLVPVLTVTKNEAVFTKGDLKLQKITVTEDISVKFKHFFKKQSMPGKTVEPKENGVNVTYTVVNPGFSGIFAEVIKEQPIRYATVGHISEDKPQRTRIPKFRQTVEKVKRQRRESKVKEKELAKEPSSQQPRRSSIPRLRPRIPPSRDVESEHLKPEKNPTVTSKHQAKGTVKHAIPAPTSSVFVKQDTGIPQPVKTNVKIKNAVAPLKMKRNDIPEDDKLKNKSADNDKKNEEEEETRHNEVIKIEDLNNEIKPEDEFDKIYEEIVDNTPTESVIGSIIVDQIDDPKSLEFCFEEIINDYEENKIQPLNIETIEQNKPFMHQKSVQDVKIPKTIDRRLSLNDVSSESKELFKTPPSTPIDIKFEKEPNIAQRVIPKETVKVATPVINIKEIEDNVENKTVESSKNEFKLFVEEPRFNGNGKLDYNTQNSSELPDSTKIVQNILFNLVKKTDKITNEDNEAATSTNTSENKDLLKIEEPKDKPEKLKIQPEPVQIKKDSIEEDNKEALIPKGKLGNIIDKFISNETKDLPKHIDISKPTGLISRIAIFNRTNKDNTDRILSSDVTNNKSNKDKPTDDDIINTDNMISLPSSDDPNNVHNTVYNRPIDPTMEPVIEETKTSPDTENPIKLQGDPEITQIKNNSSSESSQESVIYTVTENPEKNLGRNDSLEDKLKKNDSSINNDINEIVTAENKEIEHLEDMPVPRGKVSRIISRLDSGEEIKRDVPKTDVRNEIPFRRSVSSRVAMFERQASKESRDEDMHKPRVIDEILKTNNEPKVEIRRHDAKFTNQRPVNHKNFSRSHEKLDQPIDSIDDNVFEDVIPHADKSIDNHGAIDKPIKQFEIDPKPIKIEGRKRNVSDENRVHRLQNSDTSPKVTSHSDHSAGDLQKHIVSNEYINKRDNMGLVEDRLRRLTSRTEKPRSKSVAELDLGDAVVGKVQEMIIRINSKESLLEAVEKKEVIIEKERPRKMTVLQKIALFERKLTPIESTDLNSSLQDSKPHAYHATTHRPQDQTTNLPFDTTTNGKTDINTTQNPLRTPKIDRTIEINNKSNKTNDNATANGRELKISDDVYADRIQELRNARTKYGSMADMIYIKLRNGMEMPALALGTALLDEQLVVHIVKAAIDLGYRAIDAAFIYGNEKPVGEAIRDKIQDGTVTRSDLFITNKLWSTYHRQDLVEQACRASLDAMGLTYFDLYLIHNPMSFKEGGHPIPKIANVLQYSEHDYLDAWYGMEGLVSKGLVKSIGLSNFNASQVTKVNERARVKPVVNQVECHPYLNQAQLSLSCEELQIKLSCFGVLGSKGTPSELKSSNTAVIDDPIIVVMAAGLNVTAAQMLIRYQIQSGHAAVVKASSGSHLWDNLKAMTFNLSSVEMDALNALNKNKRTYTFKGMGDTHRHYPFKTPY